MTKPSDRAIAMAFWEWKSGLFSPVLGVGDTVVKRAAEIDQESPAPTDSLYHTVNRLMAVIGSDGEVSSWHATVAAVMESLRDIDGGRYAAAPDGAQAVVACWRVRRNGDDERPGMIPAWVNGPIDDERERYYKSNGCRVERAYTAPPSQVDEDAARLDFIESNRFDVCPLEGGGFDVYRYREGSNETILVASGTTARAAIDAARAARGGG